MSSMDGSTTTRYVIRLFVASVTVNAVLGIWALLAGDFGETEGRILATSFFVSAAMLSVLVNAPAIGRRVLWPAPAVGAGAAVVGFVQLIALVWADVESETWIKTAISFLVVAAGATLASNLAIIELPVRYRPALPVTALLIAVLVVSIVVAIWVEPSGDWVARVIGVESVLVAAGTLLIPALSRFAPTAGPADRPDHAGVRFCPSCGQRVGEHPLGTATTCESCGLGFEVIDAVEVVQATRPAGR